MNTIVQVSGVAYFDAIRIQDPKKPHTKLVDVRLPMGRMDPLNAVFQYFEAGTPLIEGPGFIQATVNLTIRT